MGPQILVVRPSVRLSAERALLARPSNSIWLIWLRSYLALGAFRVVPDPERFHRRRRCQMQPLCDTRATQIRR